MTSVNKILLKLDYVTKEQEETLVLPALSGVIGIFEDTFLSKADEFKTATAKLQSNFDQIDEKVLDITNNNTKLFAGTLPDQLSVDSSSDESDEDSPRRKQRTPSKSAKSLLSAFALTNNQVAEGIAEGRSVDELKQLSFPKQGLRINVTNDNDVDIQIRIQMNKDSKTFKLQQRLNKNGWKAVNGGQKIKNFSSALRHGERIITDKARDAGATIPNPDDAADTSERQEARRARRYWLLNNTFHIYEGVNKRPNVSFIDSDEEKNKYVDSFKQETFKQLEHVGVNLKDLFKPSDIVFKASSKKRPSSLIVEALLAPWAVPIILLNGIAGGVITSFNLLGKIVDKIAGGLFSTKYGPRSTVRANGKKDAPGSKTWAERAYANNGTTSWWGVLAHAISQGFKEGWKDGQALGRGVGGQLKYRAPDNDKYRDDPRAYWQERGKLVTQVARMEAKYEDAIQKAQDLLDVNLVDGEPAKRQYRNPANGELQQVIINPRADAIEQAIVNYSKAEDRIENLARPLDVSIEAVRAHFNEILSGNLDTMPPGQGYPTRFGGYLKRRQLEKNVNKYVPKSPQGRGLREAMLGKDPKFEEMHEGQQGDKRLTQVEQAGGGKGSVSTEDREYLKPGQQAPEDVKEHYAERRGKDGHQARYYSKKDAARVLDEQKNGPDKRDSNLEEEGEEEGNEEQFYSSNIDEMTKGGENEMAAKNAPKTPQDPATEQFQMAVENEVAAAKRVSQKSKARSANANARVASARADEAEVKARRAEEDREVHIGEILHKLDSSISELIVKDNPKVSKVYSQLEKTIDTIEKDISNPFKRGRNDKKFPIIHPTTTPEPSSFEAPDTRKRPVEGLDIDRHVAPKERGTGLNRLGSDSKSNTKFEIQRANANEIEGIGKARGASSGPNEINAPKILADNLSRAFRAVSGKDNEEDKKPDTTPISLPESPEATSKQPKAQSLAQQLAGTPTSTTTPTTPPPKKPFGMPGMGGGAEAPGKTFAPTAKPLGKPRFPGSGEASSAPGKTFAPTAKPSTPTSTASSTASKPATPSSTTSSTASTTPNKLVVPGAATPNPGAKLIKPGDAGFQRSKTNDLSRKKKRRKK
jgi:hypothetical protein